MLSEWAASDARPLVVFIDEIDTLVGDTLLSVLQQLRAGYPDRPGRFPQSVVLCGVRDVRDYRIHASSEPGPVLGGSAFNIKAESLRLGDFGETETRSLLAQHTAETGQGFAEDAVAEVWRLTQGQPWRVNALAHEVCFAKAGLRDRAREVTLAAVTEARERLIQRRDTHLDQLAAILEEDRVRRVVEPLLSGEESNEQLDVESLRYVRDLGLVAQTNPVRVANPIYREVIPRELTYATEAMLWHEPAWYVGEDGRLRMDELMGAFQSYFREHSEHWLERFQYREAGPQLLLQTFLHRVVNACTKVHGGGRVEREYGVGRRRLDLALIWPVRPGGPGTAAVGEQRIVVESRWCAGAGGWMRRCARGWSRRRRTWTYGVRKQVTWRCSTSARAGPGRRRCTAGRSGSGAAPSPCGGCDRRVHGSAIDPLTPHCFPQSPLHAFQRKHEVTWSFTIPTACMKA